MSEIVLTLPDDLAREADEMGILRSVTLTSLIREAIRRRKIARLTETMDKLNALPDRPTEEEIAEEIKAYRGEKREKQNVS